MNLQVGFQKGLGGFGLTGWKAADVQNPGNHSIQMVTEVRVFAYLLSLTEKATAESQHRLCW